MSSGPEDLKLLSVQDKIVASGIEDSLDGLAPRKLDEAVTAVAVDLGVDDAAEAPEEVFKLASGTPKAKFCLSIDAALQLCPSTGPRMKNWRQNC